MKTPGKLARRIAAYILVALLSSSVTYMLCQHQNGKLIELRNLLENRYIGGVEQDVLDEAAAKAMVSAVGDPWSYYIPAESFEARQLQSENAYVGIGVTIRNREDGQGIDIIQVEPESSAQKNGILPGDILVEVEGQSVRALGIEGTQKLIKGDVGTKVKLGVLRDGQRMDLTVTRSKIKRTVVSGKMLDGDIGLIRINNFNERCAEEGKAAVKTLIEQGAKALIFDVRYNPGGRVNEMTALGDYLLPEGVLFQSEDYRGKKETTRSDADCVELPMAVLINGSSYSAAEFFAAALREYDWATVVGTATSGKGYFQQVYELCDGSGVGLSVGRYYTPKGVSLAEAGGLVPDVTVEVDEETAALIYSGSLDPAEDPQIQAAVKVLREKA